MSNQPKPFFSPKKFFLLALLLILLPSPFFLRSAKNAIGVRVARNIEHLSPSAWYNKYVPDFYGSGGSGPSSILFAGYEAVSVGSCASGQGETIYVNAANIAGGDLYTNIYIIACPIGADQDIIDIFDQLIENWDFNVNVPAPKEKARIQRDTKRLSDLAVLNEILENYRANISPNKRYPALLSGTYEVGKSISYWQSWNETFGKELQATLPYPTTGQGWGPLITLDKWQDASGNSTWPTDMFYPTSVGIDYTESGCRQITAVKGQKVVDWCEDGCVECGGLAETNNLAWPTGSNPADIFVSYQDPTASSCRDLFAVQGASYSILEDNYSTAAVCAGLWSAVSPTNDVIMNFPDELVEPTAVSRGLDYNNCEHIFVVKDNMWSEYTNGTNCPYTGWTPLAYLDTIPETFEIDWPEDIQNPEAVSMAWDADGHRHIYAFKENSYREYVDYNRPYVYQTTDNGLSYSICTYFETTYPSLANLNCGQLQGSNYSPAIVQLDDQKVSVGSYFNYNISATDLDGDDITWSIDLDGAVGPCGACDPDLAIPCSCDWLIATKTSQKNTKKIYGTAPNIIENRTITITINDGNGGIQTKSFNVDVIKNDLIITSTEVTDITIGDDYEYDVEAYDPQGYYPLIYFWTSAGFPPGMNAASINTNNGLIFGTPINVGTYNVTATVQNSNPAGADTANQAFAINVNNFNIVAIPDSDIPHDFIMQFIPETNPQKVNKISWSISCASVMGDCDLVGPPDDINFQIDSTTGEITISVNAQAELYDVFTITVRAQSDLNAAIFDTKSFDITISNPLCGNGIVEAGEDCDDWDPNPIISGWGDDTDQCTDLCKFTTCGDGILQNPNGEGFWGATNTGDEECDQLNPVCCDNASCSWVCPPYIPAPPIKFTGSGMDYIEIAIADPPTDIIFPSCRIFDAASASVDLELAPVVTSTAVVYVTDVSGSMPDDFWGNVGSALVAQIDNLYNAANQPAMTAESILVGLVDFGDVVNSSPIVDIRSSTNRDNLNIVIGGPLLNGVGGYDDIGSCTATGDGIQQAQSMLSAVVVPRKIIVLLSDGSPNCGINTSTAATNAKVAGIEIYTIEYGGGAPAAMCSWSSDNGANCYTNNYSYQSVNAAAVYTSITGKILSVPTGNVTVTINGVNSVVPAPVFPVTQVTLPLDLSGVTCSSSSRIVPFAVTYAGGGGAIKFYNVKVDICESC